MSADQVVLRPTRLSDCAQLALIEKSAAVAFRSDPDLAWLADADPIPAERHTDLLTRGISYVATSPGNCLRGFITTERFGPDLHVWELSVHADWQQRGIGLRLLTEVEQSARLGGILRMTLTTFRDLAWNGIRRWDTRSFLCHGITLVGFQGALVNRSLVGT